MELNEITRIIDNLQQIEETINLANDDPRVYEKETHYYVLNRVRDCVKEMNRLKKNKCRNDV